MVILSKIGLPIRRDYGDVVTNQKRTNYSLSLDDHTKSYPINMKRKDFEIFKNYSYLLTQGGGPVPTSLIKEVNRLLIELSLEGAEICSKWDSEVADTRVLLAESICSNQDNIAFIPSISFAMNTLAATLDKNMRVLTFEDDFPNSSLSWLHNGYNVDFVKSKENGYLSIESIKECLHDDTKIIISSHVMYRTGFRQNLKEIGSLCKELDIIFIVDATQSYGVFPINVNECNIDALVFHGYKWLNVGFGIGGMYLSDKLLKNYPKPFLGYTGVIYKGEIEHDTLNFDIKQQASVFELGKSPYVKILMLRYMLKYINKIGRIKITKRVEKLVEYCIEMCNKNNINVISNFPQKNLSGIININAYGITKETLMKNGIIARSNGRMITIALHYYNNKKDINRLVTLIKNHSNR